MSRRGSNNENITRLTLVEGKSASGYREEGTNMRDIKKLH